MAFTFCATFKRAINKPKTDLRLFFFSNLSINVSFQEKKFIINPRFYFTDTRKQLWNIYESAVSITSPLKTITDPLKEIKMVKTYPIKVPSQIFFLLVLLGTIAQLFMKKKFPLHNTFDIRLYFVLWITRIRFYKNLKTKNEHKKITWIFSMKQKYSHSTILMNFFFMQHSAFILMYVKNSYLIATPHAPHSSWIWQLFFEVLTYPKQVSALGKSLIYLWKTCFLLKHLAL